jgi:hypothetical protein
MNTTPQQIVATQGKQQQRKVEANNNTKEGEVNT